MEAQRQTSSKRDSSDHVVWKRSELRVRLRSAALIKTADQEQSCELKDLSERGARIKIAYSPVPDRFELLVGDGLPARAAHVRWRKGDEIGLQFHPRVAGESVPDVLLASGDRAIVNLKTVVRDGRSVLVGVVGAFAPDRMQIHLTEVLTRAVDLRRLGFDRLLCIAPNDPWTVKAWADMADPDHRMLFLSDGNLDLARWLGVTFGASRRRHLGVRSRSYLALLRSGVIERLSIDSIAANLRFDESRDLYPNSQPAPLV